MKTAFIPSKTISTATGHVFCYYDPTKNQKLNIKLAK